MVRAPGSEMIGPRVNGKTFRALGLQGSPLWDPAKGSCSWFCLLECYSPALMQLRWVMLLYPCLLLKWDKGHEKKDNTVSFAPIFIKCPWPVWENDPPPLPFLDQGVRLVLKGGEVLSFCFSFVTFKNTLVFFFLKLHFIKIGSLIFGLVCKWTYNFSDVTCVLLMYCYCYYYYYYYYYYYLIVK